jgi:hypothetical protein
MQHGVTRTLRCLFALALAACTAPSLDGAGVEDVPTAGGKSGAANIAKKKADAYVVESDMMFRQDPTETIVASTTSGVVRWPNGVIPYEIDPGLQKPERVQQAADHWLQKTGIKFVPRTNQADYVRFFQGDGCWSYVGKVGGKQDSSIPWRDDYVCPLETVIHEMGHAVGLAHEQSRSDRDDHITIHWENIEAGGEAQFVKTNFQSIGEYDVTSTMQYPSWFLSKNKQPTMTTKDGKLIEQAKSLSDKDVAGVLEYYAKELKGDNSNTGGGKTVALTWPMKSSTATYSIDVQDGNGKWIAPCIDAGILQRSLQTSFNGFCPSINDSVGLQYVQAIRLCWTENNDWSKASCETVPYTGQTALGL